MGRAGKGKEEACRRKTGARNVGVCKFGAGGGERAIGGGGERQKRRTGHFFKPRGCRLPNC